MNPYNKMTSQQNMIRQNSITKDEDSTNQPTNESMNERNSWTNKQSKLENLLTSTDRDSMS